MGSKVSLSTIFFITLVHFCNTDDHPQTTVIETKYGKIKGDVVNANDSEFLVSVFKGIPFGEANIFEKPRPVKPWSNVLQARQFGKRCLQHLIFGLIEPIFANDTSEDCLFLNVFAPYKQETTYPVMFFIHGGGLALGSSNTYGQEGIVNWMVPKGVIIVTINYRLGPWGFFSTEDSTAPGNYGLWDQVLALKWVNENIGRFGGDPNRVTVFGESAGAVATSWLALSPHSRDLFQQSIVMSGSSYLPWFGVGGHTLEVSEYLSKKLGCGALVKSGKALDTKRAVECIKSKSTAEIMAALHSYRPFGNFEYTGFTGVVDGDFFPEPFDMLQERAPPKALISGTTADEMGAFVTPATPADIEWVLGDPDSFTIDQLQGKLHYFFPESTYGNWTPLVHKLAVYHYIDALGDRRNSSFLVEQYKKLFGDFLFLHPAYKEALERYHKGSKVWFYIFDYYDSAIFPGHHKYRGAQHFNELPYLFEMEPHFHPSPFEGNDKRIAGIMTTLWTNFAIYGHPKLPGSRFSDDFTWEPINDQHPNRYLRIGVKTEQRELYNRQMVSFWYELLPSVQRPLKESERVNGEKALKVEL